MIGSGSMGSMNMLNNLANFGKSTSTFANLDGNAINKAFKEKMKVKEGKESILFGDTMARGSISQLSSLGSFNKNVDPSYFPGKSKEEVDKIFKSFEKRRQEILLQRTRPSISQVLLTR